MSARSLSVVLVAIALALGGGDAMAKGAARTKGSSAARAKKKTARSSKARARRVPAKARKAGRSAGDRGSRLRAKIFGVKGKDGRKGAGLIGKRSSVRSRIANAKSQRSSGLLRDAARTATGNRARNLNIRERFALWRAARQLRRPAMRQARKRSKSGDIEGTRDALKALETLEKGGRLGVVARWRKARAEKKAFKNTFRSARRAVKDGETSRARELQKFAAELGVSPRANRKQLSKLANQTLKLARKYAKDGNPDAAWQALKMEAELRDLARPQGRQGIRRKLKTRRGIEKLNQKQRAKVEKRAVAIMNIAYKRSAKALVKEANKAYKAGNFDEAATKVAEANRIAALKDVKVSRRTARLSSRLTKKLGPRMLTASKKVNERSEEDVIEAGHAAAARKRGRGSTSEQMIMATGK